MKVCVGSITRSHTFDLAKQMERLGHLGRVYTGYPRWKVDGLPQEKVMTFPWLVGPTMLLSRWGFHGLARRLSPLAVEVFDRWMATKLESCGVFHSLSGAGLLSHRVMKDRHGALTVCDRGSSHVLYQDEILAEEYDRWRIPYPGIDRRIVERELREYEECDLIFVPSSFVYRSFVEKGVPPSKLAKVPYGVDLSLFRPVPKEDDVFRVIYVGAMSLQKGIPYLLEAVARLRLPKFELWLIGGVTPEIRSFMAKYEGGYRFLGALPRTELYKHYSQGSVFVIASVQEGLALVQAQAMACGLPVIATTNTGGEDLLKDGAEGFIVPIRDPAAIREKVVYLYENAAVREQMAKAALDRVKSLGGWDTYGDTAVSSYLSALARRREEGTARPG
jgi:starch synthase